MKQGRTPDRVHVVHPPQDEFRPTSAPPLAANPPPQPPRGVELIRMLAQISDKLKRSEAERYELLAELREYRKSLNELEDKAEQSEKAYLSLENKIKSRDLVETEISQRQARFERALKEAESKLVQAAAGQTLLDKRLKENEDKQIAIYQQIDASVEQQTRLDRQMEKMGQDKARILRKMERMEELVHETQDTLKARALILLTDQSAVAQSRIPHMPAWGDDVPLLPSAEGSASTKAPWWKKTVQMQSVGMLSMVVAALLFGWTISQVQQPEIPKIAVLENGGLATLDLDTKQWKPLEEKQKLSQSNEKTKPSSPFDQTASKTQESLTENKDTKVLTASTMPPESASKQTPAAQAILEASDTQLLEALENDPENLAAQLNEIAPAAQKEIIRDQDAPLSLSALSEKLGTGYDPLAPYAKTAFRQSPEIAHTVAKDKGTKSLTARISKDISLPSSLKNLETKAFSGNSEAQHDMAALYTAGRGGVPQNFEKAAFWFREAADQGVANAAYNLGVLYHQGLGVEKDINRALYWYREAARKNHPEASYNLGIAHIEGIGTDYNPALAAAFFESAANKGIQEAAYNLGLIYENGLLEGTTNNEQALLWYQVAADSGSPDAKAALKQLAGTMKLQDTEVRSLVQKFQELYFSTHGRYAGTGEKGKRS